MKLVPSKFEAEPEMVLPSANRTAAEKDLGGSVHVVCVVHTPPVPSETVFVQYVWSISTQGNNHTK